MLSLFKKCRKNKIWKRFELMNKHKLILIILILTENILYGETIETNKIELINKYFKKGVTYYITRDFKKASEMWKKVLEIEPSHKRAKIYFEKAFKKYQKMEVNFYTGLDYFSKRKYRKAIKYFKRTLLINPRHKKAKYYLKLCYEFLKIRIKIVDKPEKDGREIKDIEMTTDDSLTLYAIGFDGEGYYVGTVDVFWETTGTLDPIEVKEPQYYITFAPSTFDTEGKIRAFAKGLKSDETGIIKVKPGRLAYIRIMDKPEFMGNEVKEIELTTDNKITLYAAGFDKNGVYIGDIPVKWKTEGTLQKRESFGKSFTFYSHKAPATGRIIAIARSNIKAVISNVKVQPGKIAYLRIENKLDGTGDEIYSVKMTTDEKLILWACGYDQYDNFVKPVKATWITTGTLDKVYLTNSKGLVFAPVFTGEGLIKASYKGMSDETGIIKVEPGKAKYIWIVLNTKNPKRERHIIVKAGVKTNLYAGAFDKNNKFIKFYKVDWKILTDRTQFNYMNTEILNLYFTNTTKGHIKILHPELTVETNFLFEVAPSEIASIIITTNFYNPVSIDNLNLTIDQSNTLYAFSIDKFGNIISDENVWWSNATTNVSLNTNYGSYVVLIPIHPGDDKIFAVLSQSNEIFTNHIHVKVLPGKIYELFLAINNKKAKYTNNFLIGDKVIIKTLGVDKKGNIIGELKANWKYTTSFTTEIYTNTSKIILSSTIPVTNSLLECWWNKITNKIFINFIYPELSTIKLISTNNEIISNIIMKKDEKIKLVAAAFDKNNNYLYDVKVYWKVDPPTGELKYNYGITNEFYAKKPDTITTIILSNETTGLIKAGKIKVLPVEIEYVKEIKETKFSNIIIYMVYNGDTLEKIIANMLKLPRRWKYVYPYVYAIAHYNNIKNPDLIFPRQKIKFPCIVVKEPISFDEFVKQVFGSEERKQDVIVYKSRGKPSILKKDMKILLRDYNFLSTGKVKYIIIKEKQK